MILSKKHFCKRLGADFVRLATMATVIGVMVILERWLPVATGEAVLSPLTTTAMIIVGVTFISHMTRRILFPGLDLQGFAREAMKSPMSAAVVFASICAVLTALIVAHVVLLG